MPTPYLPALCDEEQAPKRGGGEGEGPTIVADSSAEERSPLSLTRKNKRGCLPSITAGDLVV